ncbi:MAG: transcriptional repressor, partial [Bacteroidales bacterium]|nr:transcriptional repressor [Bacteroidales bacterium]
MNTSIKASVKLLEEKDIRPSVQRIRVLEYLQNSKNHPTVDNIYNDLVKEIPTLSKTTVYNILKLFSEKNVARTFRIGNNEARYDGDTSIHGHFRCNKCGNIYDFNVNMEELKLAGLDKFKINEYHIYLKG